jgi:hypothetical protein
MIDRFDFFTQWLDSPASVVLTVTANDVAHLPAGSRLPVRVLRVMATGTTATNIIGGV